MVHVCKCRGTLTLQALRGGDFLPEYCCFHSNLIIQLELDGFQHKQ